MSNPVASAEPYWKFLGGLEALLATLDPNPGRRGDEFERLAMWFLRAEPRYQRELRHVWRWRDWPGRWGRDTGVDLIAEDRQGHVWAIQCKADDASHSIKKAEIDSFLSESARPEISFRLLMATTDSIGPNAARTIAAQTIPVGTCLLSDLLASEVIWPASVGALAPPPPARKSPQRHQAEAVAAAVDELRDVGRAQLRMACGTGKTLVGLWVHEGLNCDLTVVALPSLSLLAQTLNEWTAQSREDFRFLCVCSDTTVTDSDTPYAHTSTLGLPTTTDAREIARFLANDDNRRVVFATYHSLPALASAADLAQVDFDLLIADEAHRCAGPRAGLFAAALDDQNLRARRRLFMTATPRYLSQRLLRRAAADELEIVGMEDEAAFGRTIFDLGFGRAITHNLLSDYQVVIVGVDSEEMWSLIRSRNLVTLEEVDEYVANAEELAIQAAVMKAIAKYDVRACISFHSRIARARSFATAVNALAPILQFDDAATSADWVSGAMSAGERSTKLRRLRLVAPGTRMLLANARCLAEGVDVPALDGVAFVDPRQSEVDVIQAVGRAIRKSPTKRIGTIVLPVFVPADCDPKAVLETSNFKAIWQVVSALRAHDEVLAHELDELRRALGRGSSEDQFALPSKIHLDLPMSIPLSFAQTLSLQIVLHSTQTWEYFFGLLEGYTQREGTARVPILHVERGDRLGRWAADQRVRQRRGTIRPDQAKRLESLPGWTWQVAADNWTDGLRLLAQYAAREGTARPPIKHVEEGFALGRWVVHKRDDYRRGKLSHADAAALVAIPGWTWNIRAERWDRGYRSLLRYVARHGHALPPAKFIDDEGFALGAWVQSQRVNQWKAALPAPLAAQLERLPGWRWRGMRKPSEKDRRQTDAQWTRSFDALARVVKAQGHCRLPADATADGIRIGYFAVTQRNRYRRGRLSPEQIASLEALPGWSWNPHTESWDDNFERLLTFANRTGSVLVPNGHVEDGRRLDRWIEKNRREFRRGTLERWRIELLEQLPGWDWFPKR